MILDAARRKVKEEIMEEKGQNIYDKSTSTTSLATRNQ